MTPCDALVAPCGPPSMVVVWSLLLSDTAFHGSGCTPVSTNWYSGRPAGAGFVAPREELSARIVPAIKIMAISAIRRIFTHVLTGGDASTLVGSFTVTKFRCEALVDSGHRLGQSKG